MHADFIKKSLDHFDNQNLKNIKLINNENLLKDKIVFNDQILGCYYYDTNTYMWGWLLPFLNLSETKISRELLNYGLSLDPISNNVNHFFLKSLLVNSRIYVNNDFELDLLLSISSYLLKNKIDFIYPKHFKDNNNKLLFTSYFLIKISK
jgi:hypothetical protein